MHSFLIFIVYVLIELIFPRGGLRTPALIPPHASCGVSR